MFKVGRFLEVSTVNSYGADGNPESQVTLAGGWELQNMAHDIIEMREQLAKMERRQDEEARIRERNPALQDLYDQYKVVLGLVKQEPEGCDGGG